MQRPEPPAAPPKAPRPRAEEKVALLPAPLAGDPLKTTIHRLSNGMTVYLSPDKAEPSIVAHIAVRAGSRNDPEISTGLAHYLEHMLFKGTSQLGTLDYAKEKPHLEKIASLYADLRKPGADRDKILKAIDTENLASAELSVPNELDKLYAQIGVTGLNAFTDVDATVYVSQIPKNRIEQWARVESARYSDAVFRLFWPELEAVYEEKNRGMDAPQRRVHEAFMKAMFPKHGYGWSTTIGEIEHLKSPAYGDMEAFFNRYYTPGNMAILLAGDVDESVLPILEKAFGGFKRAAGEAIEDAALPPIPKRTVLDVTVPSGEGIVLGWQLVSATHPDATALEVMDLLLLGGSSGILSRDLLLTQKVADAGSNPTFRREAGYYEVTADALGGQSHDDLEKLLLASIDKLKKGDFTDADLAAAVLSHDIGAQRQQETNNGRLGLMEEAFISGEDWRQAAGKLERMRAVKKDDVMRVANKYLTANYLVVRKVKGKFEPPKIAKPGITPVKLDPTRQSPFAKSVLAMPVTAIEPVALVDGKDYVPREDPERRGRARTEPAQPAVVAAGDLRARSLGRHAAVLRARRREGVGRGEAHRGGDRAQAVRARHLVRDVLRQGSVGRDDQRHRPEPRRRHPADPRPDRQPELRRQDARRDRQVVGDGPREPDRGAAHDQRGRAAVRVVRGRHRVPGHGDQQGARGGEGHADQGVAQEAPAHQEPHHLLRPSHPGRAEVGALVQRWQGGRARAARAEVSQGPGVYAVDQQTAQTQVWMLWARPPASADDRADGTVFGEYIAPLLYQEVREARGLAYTTFGGYSTGQHKTDLASAFAYIGTQGDKTHDAFDAIGETMAKPG